MGNGQVILVVHVLVHETIVSKRHTSNPDVNCSQQLSQNSIQNLKSIKEQHSVPANAVQIECQMLAALASAAH